MSLRALFALLAVAPGLALAQRGRGFTPVESYVALGESVRVGKITSLEKIDYDKPLAGVQTYGKPYRLTFAVAETIRGKKERQVELVLSLQNSLTLEYMREHGSEILLVGGPNRIDDDPSPEVGVEEDGKRVDGHWYQFRFLDAPTEADLAKDPDLVKQILITFNEGKMFTIDLQVVQGRDAILKRARAFAKKHKEVTESVWLIVPNDFGWLVGYPNAYCGITLPVCPETERILVALLKNPGLVLDRIGPQKYYGKDWMIARTIQCMKPFPSKANAALVRGFLGDFNPASIEDVRDAAATDAQKAAWILLNEWRSLRHNGSSQ